MIKTNLLVLAISICSLSFITPNNDKKDPFLKYNKVYYTDKSEEKSGYTVELNNIIDYDNELKFSWKVINTQNDYILIKSNDSKITKLGKEIAVSEKTKLIAPNKSSAQTIKCIGGGENRAKKFSFSSHSIYTLKIDQSSQKIENVKIPLTKKDFTFGDVKCNIAVKEKSTQSSKIITSIVNNSDQYLFVYPSRIGLKMPDNNQYASKNNKDLIIIAPKKSKKITCKWDRMPGGRENDMQLVAMDLVFNDVFYFSQQENMESFVVETSWDEAMTEAKK